MDEGLLASEEELRSEEETTTDKSEDQYRAEEIKADKSKGPLLNSLLNYTT